MSSEAPPPRAEAKEKTVLTFGGLPFGPEFFGGLFAERVRATCSRRPESVPVVLLHLADGTTLDLEQLLPQCLAVMAFRNPKTCNDMDLVFVPYAHIVRVTVSAWPSHLRRIGFRVAPPTQNGR